MGKRLDSTEVSMAGALLDSESMAAEVAERLGIGAATVSRAKQVGAPSVSEETFGNILQIIGERVGIESPPLMRRLGNMSVRDAAILVASESYLTNPPTLPPEA